MEKDRAKRPFWVYILFVMGIASITIRFLMDTRFGTTAILYVAIPFIISFLLFYFKNPNSSSSLARHLQNATIVMLGSSAFLFEGFICVLFFFPIYIIFAALAFAFAEGMRARKARGQDNHLKPSIIPLIVAQRKLIIEKQI